MAQTTEVEVTPNPAAKSAPSQPETLSAAQPPAGRGSGFFQQRPQARWYLLAVLLVLIVGGYFAYRYFSSYESTDDAEVDGHLMPLSARISGYVAKVSVDDNQYVTAGTVLVEIDPKDFQVAVDQAKAALEDAQAT